MTLLYKASRVFTIVHSQSFCLRAFETIGSQRYVLYSRVLHQPANSCVHVYNRVLHQLPDSCIDVYTRVLLQLARSCVDVYSRVLLHLAGSCVCVQQRPTSAF